MSQTLKPVPPELRDYITVEIQASNRGGQHQWLAYIGTNLLFRGETLEQLQAERQAIHGWLRERLSLHHLPQDAYACLSLEQEAQLTVAQVLAEGEAADLQTALREAAAAAARVAPDLPPARVCWQGSGQKRIACGQIARVRKARATLARLNHLHRQAQAVAGADDHAPAQYLYGYVDREVFDRPIYRPYYKRWRILKTTQKFLFVDPGYDSLIYGEQEWDPGYSCCDELGRGALRIPREALMSARGWEALPWATRRRLGVAQLYLNQAELPPLTLPKAKQAAGPGSDLELLGLKTAPTSMREVKTAFRSKAREAHPDTGGSAEAFQALSEAYERVMTGLQRMVAA